MIRRLLLVAITLGAIAAAGCERVSNEAKSKDIKSQDINVEAKLTITRDDAGTFDFKYDAPFADENGNFDFSKGDPAGKVVTLRFTISDDSGLGLRFKPEGANAIWIVDKNNVGPDGSPEGPYRGDQFRDLKVFDDGKSLMLTNQNDDGVLYRYGLRFDMGSETVVDDPDMNNGQGGGGTGGTGGN